jgi:glycosyltransferase involved in cell wall biosynthesis
VRILVNTLALSPATGIDVHAFQVSRALAARGHSVHIAAQRDGHLRPAYESFAASVEVYGDFLHGPVSPSQLRHPGPLVKWAPPLTRAIRAGRTCHPDVVYANDAQALWWAVGASWWPRVGTVCHLHSTVGRPIGRQRRWLASRVDSFLAPSAFLRAEWARYGLAPERIQVVPQGVDPADYPPATAESRSVARDALGASDAAFVVVFLGRVSPDRGVETLVRAWASLQVGSGAGRLVIAGPAYPESYLRHVHQLAPADTTQFLPLQADVVPLLHAADVLVLPTVWEESFGRVVIEAMATGCPAVASDVGAIPEILTGRFASLRFPPGDAAALAQRLGQLRNWRGDDPDLGAAAMEHVARHFTLSMAVDQVEATLLAAAQG